MDGVLSHLFNACNPMTPARDHYYLDCAEVRGNGSPARQMLRWLRGARGHQKLLFTGHVGGGKSSELLALQRLLEAEPHRSELRLFPIVLAASEYLDDDDANATDLLLAVATELAATFREGELAIELKETWLSKRLSELKEFFMSDAEISKIKAPILGAKVEIQRLKTNPEARRRVREAIMPRMTTVLDEVNRILDKAREKLQATGRFDDVVLIVDDLEKIRCFGGGKPGLESQRDLFMERQPMLTGFKAHVIYSVPLRLARSPEGNVLRQRYSELFSLPMIKLARRGNVGLHADGVASLRRLLELRLKGSNASLDDAFAGDALTFLLTYSGGHVRSLMRSVQSACTYVDAPPITLRAAHRAIGKDVEAFARTIPEAHWPKLVDLDRSREGEIRNGDEDYLAMLENVSILEYVNGSEDDGPFDAFAPWYAVNPVVRELKRFKLEAASRAGPP